MSACSEVLFVGWLLLMDPILMQNIEAASTLLPTRYNDQHLEISATDEGSICTTNGIDYVLFQDQSRLDDANSKRQATEAAYEKVSMGFCQTQCNLVCSTKNLPLCAVDVATGLQRSFNNPCEMSRDACLNNIAWKLQTTNQCSAMQEKTKPILIEPKRNPTETGRKPVSCINVFNPVCAIFAGVKSTFHNECLVNAENVKTGNDWTIFSHGVCAEDYGNFGYNADQIKYNNIRSFAKTIYDDKPLEAERYYDEMAFIYTPTIIQTEYLDEIFAENFYVPPSVLISSNNQNQFRYPYKTQTLHAQAQKPMHLIDNYNELGRVIRCKYGSEPICATYKNRYRSFDNVCELMLRNSLLNQTWTTAYAGFCKKKNCPQVCTEEYTPICVSKNGVNLTISNSCYLDMKQCQDPQSTWKIVAKGQCEENILTSYFSTTSTPTLLSTQKYTTTTSPPTSRTSYKHITKTISPKTTTTKSPKTTAMAPTTTTIAPPTTTMPETKETATTTMQPSTTTTSQSITSLTFDTQKSVTTPKHYVSLTTSESTKTTTPITLSPYHSTTKAPVTTFVISAKIAPFTSSRKSIYGANRNSIIMRLVKAKAFTSPKHSSVRSFSSLTSS